MSICSFKIVPRRLDFSLSSFSLVLIYLLFSAMFLWRCRFSFYRSSLFLSFCWLFYRLCYFMYCWIAFCL